MEHISIHFYNRQKWGYVHDEDSTSVIRKPATGRDPEPVPLSSTYYSQIHRNVILPSLPSSEWTSSESFPDQNSVCISCLSQSYLHAQSIVASWISVTLTVLGDFIHKVPRYVIWQMLNTLIINTSQSVNDKTLFW